MGEPVVQGEPLVLQAGWELARTSRETAQASREVVARAAAAVRAAQHLRRQSQVLRHLLPGGGAPAAAAAAYDEGMTRPEPDLREDMTAMLAAAGITVTEEGKARARERLAAAAAQRTPQRRAEMRARVGLPPETTAA